MREVKLGREEGGRYNEQAGRRSSRPKARQVMTFAAGVMQMCNGKRAARATIILEGGGGGVNGEM